MDWNTVFLHLLQFFPVAPYVGVWIETSTFLSVVRYYHVAPYVGVWIETWIHFELHVQSNVAPYVGVWIETQTYRLITCIVSRTLCGCVDWNAGGNAVPSISACRTLCGCVDWNRRLYRFHDFASVAPYVGVWIETLLPGVQDLPCIVAPYVGVWIETWLVIVFC